MSSTNNILVTIPVESTHKIALEQASPSSTFRYVDANQVTQSDVDFAEILLGNVPPNLLHGSEKLCWVQTNSAGVEDFIKSGVLAPNTLLTNATGAYGLAISEYMMAVMFSSMKNLELYRDAQQVQTWESKGKVTSVYGATVLVLGMGDIGGEFAMRCKALGAYVIGMRRQDTLKPDYIDELCLTADLDQVLPRADVVAISLPGTKETYKMISRDRIESMKDGAIVINVGRGNIIDTDALSDALESGKLSGVCLDVTDPEPLPKGHRLWSIPKAIITPHISGFYYLKETHERIVRIFVDNLVRYNANVSLKNQIDFSSGYRKL